MSKFPPLAARRGRPRAEPAPSPSADGAADPAPAPYHHGDLHAGLLAAAERILLRDGITGLTLRAAAREAGVSHAAPKNHFGDLTGLLSELAAIGFERLSAGMLASQAAATNAAQDKRGSERASAIGGAYVRFARANPGLYLLMFRAERLDFTRSSLRDASATAFDQLAGTVGAPVGDPAAAASERPGLSLAQAARIAASWSMVHGLSMLSIDGRLAPLVERLPAGLGEVDLLEAIRRGV